MTVMGAVMMAMFLSALDQNIVSTALPTIVREFNSLESLSWVLTAYMLSSTITVPIYGKLSDMYGRKELYLLGIIIFLIGSVLCGMAESMNQLIFFRAIQGIGGGALMTNSFAIIADLFNAEERGKWQGLMGAVFGLSSVLGPFMGGWITDNLDWRWNFYFNLPIGALALAGVFFLMPKIRSSIKDKSIDWSGAISLSIFLITMLLGFTFGGTTYAWGSIQIIGLFSTALIFFIIFLLAEKRAINPVLPLTLFKNKIFSVAIALTFMTGMSMFGVISYIPLFAQKVLNISATNSGTIMFPMMIGMIFSSVIAGQIISKIKKYKVIAIVGNFFVLIGALLLSFMDGSTTQLQLVFNMVILGLGMGMTMPSFNLAIQNAFEHSKIGLVTAATQLFRSIGGTVGIAIFGTILNASIIKNSGSLDIAIPQTFFVGMLFMIVAFLITFLLKEKPLKSTLEHDILDDVAV